MVRGADRAVERAPLSGEGPSPTLLILCPMLASCSDEKHEPAILFL